MAKKKESDQPYHHGRLREALIEAGIAQREAGDNSRTLSLRGVAKRAKVSHAAPYRHFADKEALLSAIAESGFRQLAAAMQTAVNQNPSDPRQQINDIGTQYVAFATNHTAKTSLMISDLLLRKDNHEGWGDAAGGTFDILKRAVRRGQQAGVIRAGDSDEIATSLWAIEHGLAMLAKEGLLTEDITGSTANVIERAVEHLLRGLAMEE